MKLRAKNKVAKEQRLTEGRNSASTNLDRLSAQAIIRLMNREDQKVAVAVSREIPAITKAVDGFHHSCFILLVNYLVFISRPFAVPTAVRAVTA